MRGSLGLALSLATTLVLSGAALALDVKTVGKLNVPYRARLVAICTDPVVQNVLNQDFSVERRAASANSTDVVTVTVTVDQQTLRPGVSLSEVAPGDPQVASLLGQLGATPPPLEDTGTGGTDRYEAYARQMAQMPDSPGAKELRGSESVGQGGGMMGMMGPYGMMSMAPRGAYGPGPDGGGYSGGGDSNGQGYDTVVIARATLSGRSDRMTAAALVHPGDSLRHAKELLAEEIANAVLR